MLAKVEDSPRRTAPRRSRRRRPPNASRRNSPHGRLSKGHCCLLDSVSIHLRRQCMWKTWVHSPQTGESARVSTEAGGWFSADVQLSSNCTRRQTGTPSRFLGDRHASASSRLSALAAHSSTHSKDSHHPAPYTQDKCSQKPADKYHTRRRRHRRPRRRRHTPSRRNGTACAARSRCPISRRRRGGRL